MAAPPSAWTTVGVELGGVGFFSSDPTIGFLEFENQWFADALPPSGKILVLGAGAGREVLALRELGYVMDATEPNPEACEALRVNCGGRSWALTHQEVADGRGPDSMDYAAVLIGWGSLSYVLSGDERIALLERCAKLCPTGPILASYWDAPGTLGRAGRWGAGWAKRLGARGELPDGLRFAIHGGFLHGFTDDEIVALGNLVGRDSVISKIGTPHVTWRSRAQSSRGERSIG